MAKTSVGQLIPDARRGQRWGTVALLGALLASLLAGCADDAEPTSAAAEPKAAGSSTAGEGTTGLAPSPSESAAPGAGGEPGESPSAGSGSSTEGEDPEGEDPEVDPNQTDDGEPGEPDAQGRQGDVFDRIPGLDKAGCVNVGDQRDVRSGGFVAGAFDEARATYGTARPGFGKRDVRLYFVPLHAAKMPGVRIQASGPGGARGDVVRTTNADTDSWKFYDSILRLKRGGEWTFRVVAGPDRGCFTATI